MVKRIIVSILTLAMCFSMSSTAFAVEAKKDTPKENSGIEVSESILATENAEIVPFGGAETWSKTSSFRNVGSFTMEGNNLTPVKTMGGAGQLSIRLDDVYPVNSLDSIDLLVQIVDHNTQKVLKEWKIYDFTYLANYELSGSVNVQSGKKIQVFFKVFDTDTGKYNDSRQVKINYSYRLK